MLIIGQQYGREVTFTSYFFHLPRASRASGCCFCSFRFRDVRYHGVISCAAPTNIRSSAFLSGLNAVVKIGVLCNTMYNIILYRSFGQQKRTNQITPTLCTLERRRRYPRCLRPAASLTTSAVPRSCGRKPLKRGRVPGGGRWARRPCSSEG